MTVSRSLDAKDPMNRMRHPNPLCAAALLAGLAAFSAAAARAQSPADLDARAVMGHNKSFGLVPPGTFFPPVTRQAGTRLLGNDVSSWQGAISPAKWATYKTGRQFVVIRSSYGNGGSDSQYATNRANVEAAGIPAGFYHYAYPSIHPAVPSGAQLEADSFANAVKPLKQGQFVVLDFEDPDYAPATTTEKVAWAKAFLDELQSKLGVKPFVYTSGSWEKNLPWTPVVNAGYPLWLASWPSNPHPLTDNPPTTKYWTSVPLWQYSDDDTPPGIPQTDGDVFFGTVAQLQAYGWQAPAPPVVVNPSTIAWTTLPPAQNRWYNDAQQLAYSVGGSLPNTVEEKVDGVVQATKSTSGSAIVLNTVTPGMHAFEVTASNSANSAPVSTGTWTGGYDPNPPTVARTGDVQPSTWYLSAQTVTFSVADALSGVRQFRYQWDDGDFSEWTTTGTDGSVPLPEGKHHLTVQAEDASYAGATAQGNRATVDLGEFWLSTAPQSVALSAVISSRTNASTTLQITLKNTSTGPDTSVGVDLLQLGAAKAGAPWEIGNLEPGASATKTVTFPVAFDSNKSLLLSANVHYGGETRRLRVRVARH